MTPHPALDLVVGHLNAPVGAVVGVEALRAALCAGSLTAVDDPAAAARISYLFVEATPELIARCAREAGTTVQNAHRLYQEVLQDALPRVPRWEQAMTYWV